jgi:hypothetical protein
MECPFRCPGDAGGNNPQDVAALCVNNSYDMPNKFPNPNPPKLTMFTFGRGVVSFWVSKNSIHIVKIDTVLGDIGTPFVFIPFKLHA